MSTASWWAEQLRAVTVKRELAEKATDLIAACSNGHDLAEIVEAVGALYRGALAADPASRDRVAPTTQVMERIAAEIKGSRGRRVKMGLPTFDRRAMGGLAPGQVLTIVARPAVGKSALLSQILLHAAMANERAVFFSLEMPREQALMRMVQQATASPRQEVEADAGAGWPILSSKGAVSCIRDRLVFVDRGKSNVEALDASIHEASVILGALPSIVAIDYLGLLCSGAKNISMYQRVSEAAIDIKSFAKRHKIAVVLACQAGRDQDQARSDGAARLGLDAARDSGQVEEGADFILTLWRPELDSRKSPVERHDLKGKMDACMVKNRDGETGDVALWFDAETLRIGEREESRRV